MIFKRLTETAIEPVRSTEESAGLDLHADEDLTIYPNEIRLIKTGISFENDDGRDDWYIDLRVRSSIALKKKLLLANGAGVIDKSYAGHEIKVMLFNAGEYRQLIVKGERIAQMLILPHLMGMARGVTLKYDKRVGGFGSTGS